MTFSDEAFSNCWLELVGQVNHIQMAVSYKLAAIIKFCIFIVHNQIRRSEFKGRYASGQNRLGEMALILTRTCLARILYVDYAVARIMKPHLHSRWALNF